MPDTNKPPTLVAIGEGNVNKPTNTPDTGYTLEKMQKIKADTPDTDVGGVVIDNSPRGRLISLFGAMNLDVAKPWVDEAIAEATSSRDTYWKERVRKEVEGMKRKVTFNGSDESGFIQYGQVIDSDCEYNQALDTLLDNLK